MTNEERDLIARFIARVGGAPQSGGFLGGSGGSVPSSQPPLPPIDRDADSFIGQQFQQFPEARYRITQTAVVTEAALAEAQNRIKRLEWELEQTKAAADQAVQQAAAQAQQSAPQAGQQRSGGFFSNMFGGGGQQQQPRPGFQGQPFGQQGAPQGQPAWGGGYQPTSAPPQPQYAPGYQPGMFQRGGSGFLGSALTTAAGVAGGMVVGNALMSAFEGHRGTAEAAAGSLANASPWGTNASNSSPFDGAGVTPTDPTAGFGSDNAGSDPFAGGGATKQDSGYDTQASWGQGGGFDDSNSGGGGFDGGGFDNGGGGGGFDGGGGGFDDNNT